MNKHFTRQQTGDLVSGDPAVRTANPEVFRRLLIGQPSEKDALPAQMMLPRARWTWNDMDSDGDGKISVSEWHDAMQAAHR